MIGTGDRNGLSRLCLQAANINMIQCTAKYLGAQIRAKGDGAETKGVSKVIHHRLPLPAPGIEITREYHWALMLLKQLGQRSKLLS